MGSEHWGEPPIFAMPRRDNLFVMLNQVDRLILHPRGNEKNRDAYFWCDGVDQLPAEFEASGADIMLGPEDRPEYGQREIAVRDVDGNTLVFSEDISAR